MARRTGNVLEEYHSSAWTREPEKTADQKHERWRWSFTVTQKHWTVDRMDLDLRDGGKRPQWVCRNTVCPSGTTENSPEFAHQANDFHIEIPNRNDYICGVEKDQALLPKRQRKPVVTRNSWTNKKNLALIWSDTHSYIIFPTSTQEGLRPPCRLWSVWFPPYINRQDGWFISSDKCLSNSVTDKAELMPTDGVLHTLCSWEPCLPQWRNPST